MKYRQHNHWRSGFICIFLACLLYLSIFGVRQYFGYQNNPQHIAKKFQNRLFALESETKTKLDFLKTNFNSSDKAGNLFEDFSIGNKEKENEIFMFVFLDDSLIYWNNNEVLLPANFIKAVERENFACKLKNGWYGFHCIKNGSYHFVGSYLIKSNFPFQNEFIMNSFSPRLHTPASVAISEKQGPNPVYSSDRTYLFSLDFSHFRPETEQINNLILILFVLISLCFLYFLFRFVAGLPLLKARGNLLLITYSTTIVVLRIIQGNVGFPAEVYQSALFSPAWYSSSVFLPSLGDFTLNVILFFVMSCVFYKKYSFKPNFGKNTRPKRLFRQILTLLILLVSFQGIGYFVTDLVLNSSISLNLQNISALNIESGFGLFIIIALMFSLWLISTKLFGLIFRVPTQTKWLILSLIITAGAYSLFCSLIGWEINFSITVFFLIYSFFFWFFIARKSRKLSVQNLLIFLCFFAFFATFLLNRSNQIKETQKLNLLAAKFVSQRNPITEVLFEQVERKIHLDSVLYQWIDQSSVNRSNQDSLVNYMLSQYFKGYWKKYQVQITYCDPTKDLRIQPQDYLINCDAYFRGIIRNYGESTICPNLFFLDYGFGKEYYLAIISDKEFLTHSEPQPAIFLEFNLKNTFPDPGYPGLLMDKTRSDIPALSAYSYGLFQKGRLIRAVGDIDYKMELGQYKNFSRRKLFFSEDQTLHFQYKINESDALLISKKENLFLAFATPFSYFFILFSILILIVAGVVNFPKKRNPIPTSLRSRLQLSLIGLLMVTMLAIGIVQVINIFQLNSKKNIDNLREKAFSVVVEVQHRYSSQTRIQRNTKGDLEDFLVKLSNVFFTDINVYNVNGVLISSSRSQIFEEGLLSERMNAQAYQKLIVEKNSIFIQNESIGNMHFNSAYLPFYNEHNQLLGFVNLPYFAKQDESKKEISFFLVTFVNVYILLILFGVFITVLISNYITSPLAMLAEKISHLRLGRVNEKISWKQKDEIGQLVSEYNRMIDELGISAEKLARSERESAWREMARQVAHEIKNPLTPMKLSAQHLEKAWKEKAPDWDQRLARFTKTLVEQIDALSVIASDFSDFAKKPTVEFTQVNLEEVICFVLSLYQDTTPVRYEFCNEAGRPIVLGDRVQLIRVFTNLINNACQAIIEPQEGIILIHIAQEQQQLIVKVSDNGAGISFERSEKIFQPDFTTKTSGMGLGLAIVKGLVEGMNGEISFISEEQKGTTFTIKFPVYGE